MKFRFWSERFEEFKECNQIEAEILDKLGFKVQISYDSYNWSDFK